MPTMAVESKGKLKTYLLLGQSNMVGWGDYSSLDSTWAKRLELNNRIHFCSKETKYKVAKLKASRRATLKPYNVKGTFGPEYSFIDTLSQIYPEEDLLFLKHAVGGTTLYAAWNKEWDLEKAKQVKETLEGKHRLYELLLNRVKVAEAFAQFEGYQGIDIKAIAWVQGESDATRDFTAKSYKDNFKKFIINLRKDLPDSDFKFVYLQINNKAPFVEDIRRSQSELSKEMKNVFMIPASKADQVDGFSKYDKVHYNAEGLIEIGRALGQKVCDSN
jgi:uncharacterized pyridoxamine 5'-phosphate oxidase family protein